MECLDKHDADPFKRWLAAFEPATETGFGAKPKKSVVRCNSCNAYITENQFLIPINGETNHFFSNPSGMGFDLLTYEHADGCMVSGKSTDHFSWFEGYCWQYCYCKQCNNHIGWYYSCDGIDRFFGLITDCLRIE